jgi:glycosyltransferase involved in cell wall biosynthesis
VIRVLHLRDTDRICGPGKTILETVDHIDSSRFDLSIGLFLSRTDSDNIYYREALARGFKVVPFRSLNPYDPTLVPRIVRYVEEERIDIIHSHDYKTDLLTYAAARMTSIIAVTTQHGWITNTLKSRAIIGLQSLVLHAFDSVIAVSAKMRDDLLSLGVSEEKIELIYNAIVSSKYVPDSSRRDYLRHELCLPENAVLIGNVGRLSPEKGQRDFIAAAGILAASRNDLYFVLAGDGPDRTLLERQAEQTGLEERVFFLGNVLEMSPVYDGLDIVALTSHTEGFPNVVMESMCMEKPVLATRVGGTGDLVRNRETGILVESGSPRLIAEGLQTILDHPDLRDSMVRSAKHEVMTAYDFQRRTERIEELYRHLVGES